MNLEARSSLEEPVTLDLVIGVRIGLRAFTCQLKMFDAQGVLTSMRGVIIVHVQSITTTRSQRL
jgi:hypothetical protein